MVLVLVMMMWVYQDKTLCESTIVAASSQGAAQTIAVSAVRDTHAPPPSVVISTTLGNYTLGTSPGILMSETIPNCQVSEEPD